MRCSRYRPISVDANGQAAYLSRGVTTQGVQPACPALPTSYKETEPLKTRPPRRALGGEGHKEFVNDVSSFANSGGDPVPRYHRRP